MRIKDLEAELGKIIFNISMQQEYVLIEEEKNQYRVWGEPCYLDIPDLGIRVVTAMNNSQESRHEIR